MRGRKIFGDVRPYGKVWRTGANSPTKLMVSDEVTINGTKVPKGKYAVFSIPDQNEWTVILSKDTTLNEGNYKETSDLAL